MSYKRQRQPGYQIDLRRQSVRILQARGKGKGNPGIKVAQEAFESRSQRARTMDLLKMADIAPSVSAWLKCPNRLDLPGLDTPDAELVFSHRSKRSQAQDLARAAKRKVSVEVWIGDPSKVDLKGIDTPSSKKPKPRRFKVVEKGKADAVELKRSESKKAEEKKHTLPTKTQILEKAQAIHKEELVKGGLPVVSAEESELKETGDFERARNELMRGEQSKADSQVLQYIDDLRKELEPLGFSIIEAS
jgi:hypothetical protein